MFSPQTWSRCAVEPQLRERNPQLGGPAVGVDAVSRLPDRIEAASNASSLSLGVVPIEAHARGGDAEGVRRSGGRETCRARPGCARPGVAVVAAAERRLDRRPLRVEHPRADVERAVVVDEAHLHRVGRRGAFGRLLLDEVGDRASRRSQASSSSRPSTRIAPPATLAAAACLRPLAIAVWPSAAAGCAANAHSINQSARRMPAASCHRFLHRLGQNVDERFEQRLLAPSCVSHRCA